MGREHFVGREDAVNRLRAVFTGNDSAPGRLKVQSVEGPGGIGKTYLLDHVLATTDVSPRKYLTLRVDGHDPDVRSLVRGVSRMVDNAQADAIRGRPAGSYFLEVNQVIKEIDAIRHEAQAEFQKVREKIGPGDENLPSDKEALSALLQFLELAFEAGKLVNDAVPILMHLPVSRATRLAWRVALAQMSRYRT